jgi:hypothetical protein
MVYTATFFNRIPIGLRASIKHQCNFRKWLLMCLYKSISLAVYLDERKDLNELKRLGN